MTKNKFVELGELISPAPTVRAGNNTYPLLSMTMHHGLVEQSKKFKKRIASADTSSYKVVSEGQLVVGFPIDEGVLAIQRGFDSAAVSPAYDVWDIVDTSIHSQFLERYLRSPHAIAYYRVKLKSTTARRRTLNRNDFLSLRVPKPSMSQQTRAVAALDQVDTLRKKRRESIDLIDDLAHSIFIDMFGDPVKNERGWTNVTVSEFVREFQSGKSLAQAPADSKSDIRILKISAVTSGTFSEAESKPAPTGYNPPASHFVRNGDLLFSRANTSELIGATAIVHTDPKNLLLPDKLWRFRWKDESSIDPQFIHYLFRHPSFRDQIARAATGSSGSMKNISQSKVMGLRTALPPAELQSLFGSRVSACRQQRSDVLRHLRYLDTLFASIQSRAFRGELWQDDVKDS